MSSWFPDLFDLLETPLAHRRVFRVGQKIPIVDPVVELVFVFEPEEKREQRDENLVEERVDASVVQSVSLFVKNFESRCCHVNEPSR